MDVPEPDQTPFNAVQAQTSKLARVRLFLSKQCRDLDHRRASLRSKPLIIQRKCARELFKLTHIYV